jgi:protein-S-isoprenylcysteine O-methyltransferase Ste14
MADSTSSAGRPDTAGVIAPPPLIFAAFLLVGWLIGWIIGPAGSPAFLQAAPVAWLGALLVVLALALGGSAVLTLRRGRTSVDPYQPTTALMRAGPFKYSRNPIYVGLMLLSVGLALLAGSAWMVLLVIPAAIILRVGVVAREEVYLERKFGDEYRRYVGEVRRWL